MAIFIVGIWMVESNMGITVYYYKGLLLKILWSEEDDTFLVYIPEFGSTAHGDTLKVTKRMGEELIDLMLENDIID